MRQEVKKRLPKKLAKIALLVVGGATVFGFVVMGLWNELIPDITGWHAITFWQALGILILSKILFGGFHGRPGWRGRWKHRLSGWNQMTPEEREKFRQIILTRCPGAKLPAEEL